jgi:hypothetical protein
MLRLVPRIEAYDVLTDTWHPRTRPTARAAVNLCYEFGKNWRESGMANSCPVRNRVIVAFLFLCIARLPTPVAYAAPPARTDSYQIVHVYPHDPKGNIATSCGTTKDDSGSLADDVPDDMLEPRICRW